MTTVNTNSSDENRLIANIDKIKIGYSYQVNLPQYFKPRRIHIRSLVDDYQIVYAFFGTHKKWWHYSIESVFMISMLVDNGSFKLDTKKKTPAKYFL